MNRGSDYNEFTDSESQKPLGNTVEFALTRSQDQTGDRRVPTLRLGAPVRDAPRPGGFPSWSDPSRRRASQTAFPRGSVGTRTQPFSAFRLSLIQRYCA